MIMKKWDCEYLVGASGDNEKITISASSEEEAYEKFLEQKGSKPFKVFISPQGLFASGGGVYEGHLDEAQAIKAMEDEKVEQSNKIARKAHEGALKSLSSTDILLKQLIEQQRDSHQVLLKIRRSLAVITTILVLWNAFGWVIKIK